MSEWDWRFLSSRVKAAQSGATSLQGHSIVVIQHGLPDLIHLVDSFVKVGCDPEGLTVIGIPYSSRQQAADAIRALHPQCKVYLPRVMPFEGYVCHALTESLERCRQRHSRLIIVEDGGYAVPLVTQLLDLGVASPEHLLGAVEQTTRGANIDKALQSRNFLRLPVISIPDCVLKQDEQLEPPRIAEAVNRSLRKLVNRITDGHADSTIKAVGVYGLGAIGGNVARFMKNAGADVYVSDFNQKRMHAARKEGMKELDSTTVMRCDLVIGATGYTSIGSAVLPNLKDGAIIASASSRQVEIDVSWLEANATDVDSDSFDVEVVQELKAYREYARKDGNGSVFLLYDGYPINFYGLSLPDNVADVVLSLLFEGVLTLVRKRESLSNIVYSGSDILKDAESEIAGDLKPEWGF